VGVEFTTMSKGYNMAGWRVGFCCGNAEMIRALATIKGYYDYGMFQAIQIAAIVALRHTEAAVEKQSRDLPAPPRRAGGRPARIGWEDRPAAAGMFVWAKIPSRGSRMNTMDFAMMLLEKGTWPSAPAAASAPPAKAWTILPNGLPKTPRSQSGPHVVALDFGMKWNIPRHLVDMGCRVTIAPGQYNADQILALAPDGVFLSNGPGDPEPLEYAIGTIRTLLGHKPVFGICLGHQLLSLACGGRTFKMKFGHRGANQPVHDLITDRVEITSQNHGFAVEEESLPAELEVTHRSLNDGTVEGVRHRELPAFSVQYHPEASAGPHDSHYLFRRFLQQMTGEQD
jgi:anthranilate/para-aminobenzoate synthase component II